MPQPRSSTDSQANARWRKGEAIAGRISAQLSTIKLANLNSLSSKALALGLIGASLLFFAPTATESAAANGDTRTLYLYNPHTRESIDARYRVDGHYDPTVLKQLNWFLRDWRLNQETNMDPRLFDAVWEAYRGAGATTRIVVLCGYRSPQTNAMLRRRSRLVAEHSQHILGKAMDTTMPGMSMERVREAAVRLQMGGVGYYGTTNFVHIDVGGVRMWPRMSYAQLMRLFPDGRSVEIASDGRTLPGYAQARAELAANGTSEARLPPPKSSGVGAFFAWLFGKGNAGDDEDAATAQPTPGAPSQPVETASAAAPAMQADATGSIPDSPVHVAGEAAVMPAPDMPLPPHRPEHLAAADVPLPPARPDLRPDASAAPATPAPHAATAAAASFRIASAGDMSRPSALPSLITQGPDDGRPRQGFARRAALPAQLLAYAAVTQAAAAAPHAAHTPSAVTIVPARLDESDFRSLTGSTGLADLASETIFGPTLAGLRSAARVEAAAFSRRYAIGRLEHFRSVLRLLPPGHFSTGTAADRGSALARVDSRNAD